MGQSWSTPVNEPEAVTKPRMDLGAQSLQPKKLRNPHVTVLSEILKEKVKLDESLVKENNAILHEFLDSFIPEMRKHDKLFDSLYQRIYYTGSFYSDLRVSKPDEFDLNIVLKIPFKLQEVSVQYHPQVPSYVKYRVTNDKSITRENPLSKLLNDGYLIPTKVRTWMQSIVKKAMNTYKPPHNIIKVQESASGPARTIILIKRNLGEIDIDLVPAVECVLNSKPPGIDGRVFAKVSNNLKCFIVPKPYDPSKQAPVNETERSRLWRVHYPEAESEIIHDLQCAKPVIKLLKLLRDRCDWKIIASYYLKTIVMWMILENPDKEYWKMDKIYERFMEALRELAKCIKERKIRYFFSSRYNLISKLSEAEAGNIFGRLGGIMKDIEKDYTNLWKIFSCPPTF